MKKVELYTDGACSGNPGPGGWACVLRYNEHEKEASGFEAETTNNRMELRAVIEGLRLLRQSCEVTVYSDSSYVCNAFNEGWIFGWQRKSWMKSDKQPVLNKELWLDLLHEKAKHKVEFIWVKGHASNEMNNRCDKAARKAIDEFRGTSS